MGETLEKGRAQGGVGYDKKKHEDYVTAKIGSISFVESSQAMNRYSRCYQRAPTLTPQGRLVRVKHLKGGRCHYRHVLGLEKLRMQGRFTSLDM